MMLWRFLAAGAVVVFCVLACRVWVSLPPERTPADYARERLQENDRERV